MVLAANQGYELEAGTRMLAAACMFCGRPLRDPASLERGCGPDCARRWEVFEHVHPARPADVAGALETAPAALREAYERHQGDPRAAVSAIIHATGAAWERNDAELALYLGAAMELTEALGYPGTAKGIRAVFIEGRRFDESGEVRGKAKPKGIMVLARGERWELALPFIENYSVWKATMRALDAAGARSLGREKGYRVDFPPERWEHILNALVDTLAGTLGVLPTGEAFVVPAEKVPVPEAAPAPGAPTAVDPPKPAPPPDVKVGDTVELRDGRVMVVSWVGDRRIGIVTPEDAKRSMARWGYIWNRKFNAGYLGIDQVRTVLPTEAEKREVEEETEQALPPKPREIPEALMPHQREGVLWLDQMRSGLLAFEQGTGKCQEPGAMVWTLDGPIAIESLWTRPLRRQLSDADGGEWGVLREPVLLQTWNAERTRLESVSVERLYRERVRTRTVHVTLDDGSELRCTAPHRVLTPSGWVTASALKSGDRVAVAATVQLQGAGRVPVAAAELMGWQLAEGHEEQDKSAAAFTNSDPKILARVRRLSAALGYPLKRPRPDRSPGVQKVSMGCLRRQFLAYGFPWGTRSAKRRIPDVIRSADETARRAFLRAFIDAEGCIAETNRSLEITSASRWLMREVAALLRADGIWLRLRRKRAKASNSRTPMVRTYWRGFISGNSLARFADCIGFFTVRKQRALVRALSCKRNTNVEAVPATAIVRAASVRGVKYRALGLPNNEYERGAGMSKPLAMDAARRLDEHGHSDLADSLRSLASEAIHWARVRHVRRRRYSGYVYDLSVPGTENYITDGVITHNTPTALAALDAKALVVVPASLRVNWVREAARWRPDLVVAKADGASDVDETALAADVLVLSYETLKPEVVEKITRRGLATLIVDEAQAMKELKVWYRRSGEPKASGPQRAQAVFQLSRVAKRRFFLTGTPMINGRPYELWPLLHMIDAEEWRSQKDYWNRYCDPKEVFVPGGRTILDVKGKANLPELRERIIGKYMLRKTKDVIDLPPKSREVKHVAMDPDTARDYRAAATAFIAWIEEMRGPEAAMRAARAEVIARLTALRRLAAIGKAPAVLEDADRFLRDTGRPLILMGHHREALAMVESGLAALGWKVGTITGDQTGKQRQTTVDAFQLGEPQTKPPEKRKFLDALVCSITAAGVGLTLTRAQDMFIFERVWRPFDLVQAEDREHRIGQKNKVTIVYYDAPGTIDQKLAALLVEKMHTAEQVIDGLDLDEEEAQDQVVQDMFSGLTAEMMRNAAEGADEVGYVALVDWADPEST